MTGDTRGLAKCVSRKQKTRPCVSAAHLLSLSIPPPSPPPPLALYFPPSISPLCVSLSSPLSFVREWTWALSHRKSDTCGTSLAGYSVKCVFCVAKIKECLGWFTCPPPTHPSVVGKLEQRDASLCEDTLKNIKTSGYTLSEHFIAPANANI